jgi:hypothetical protein
MLHAIWLLAVDEHEPSKVPFYICGALLAVWAVVVAFMGLSRPEFPADVRESRAVMAISATLVIAAMTTALVTS